MALPSGNLDIVLSNNEIFAGTQTNDFVMYTTTSNQNLRMSAAPHLGVQLSLLSNNNIVVNSNVNIGVGTTTPLSTLDVRGTVSATSYSNLPIGSVALKGVVQVSTSQSVSDSNTSLCASAYSIYQLSNSLSTLSNNVGNLGSIVTLSNSVTSLSSNVGTLSNNVTTLTTSLSNNFTTLSNNFTSLSNNFTTLSNNVTTNQATLTTLSNSYTTLSNNFTTLSNNVTTLSNNVTTLSNNITDLTTQNITLSNTAYLKTGGVISGDVTVTGNVVPSSNVAYDLGTSNNRWRDLYISGNTIDMAGTKISRTTGGDLQFMDGASNLKRIIVEEIQIGATTNGVTTKLKKNATDNTVQLVTSSNNVDTVSSLGNAVSTYLTGNTFGSESTPINGGVLAVTTSTSLSAIVELSSNAGGLTINLDPTGHFDIGSVGQSGNLVIVERNTAGRALTIDPRIHFPTEFNRGAIAGFSNSLLQGTTITGNITTTAAPLGGFAVDTISYYVPKVGFAIGNYYRQFKCVPPSISQSIPVQTGMYAAPSAFTFSTSTYITNTSPTLAGPIVYSMVAASGSPVIPGTMTLNSSSGVITISQYTGYTGTVTVSVMSAGPKISSNIQFGVLPYYAPVVSVAPTVPANTDTALAAYTTPAPTMTQNTTFTGALTWSISPSVNPALGTLNTSTGQITFLKNTAFSGGFTLTATGPSGLTGSTVISSFSILPWVSPTFTTDFTTINQSTAVGAYTITPSLAQTSAQTGTVTYSITPSSLTTYLNTSTGVLTFPIRTDIATTSVVLTATGANGNTTSDSFTLKVLPWDQPVLNTITPSALYYTGPSAPTIQPVQTATNMGTATWSIVNTPTNVDVTINSTSGLITIAQNAAAITGLSVNVIVTGPTGLSANRTFTLNSAVWAQPVFTTKDSDNVTLSSSMSKSVISAGYSIIPTLTDSLNSGTIVWSFVSTPGLPVSGVSFDTSTGVLSVNQGTSTSFTNCRITATGPMVGGVPKSTSSLTFTLSTIVYVAPTFTLSDSAGTNITGGVEHWVTTQTGVAFTPTVTNTAMVGGAITWSYTLSASAFGTASFNTSTGVLTLSGSSLDYVTVTIKGSGPYGESSISFYLNADTYDTASAYMELDIGLKGNVSSNPFYVACMFRGNYIGPLVWSLTTSGGNMSQSTLLTYFDSSTGVLSVPINVIVTNVTLRFSARTKWRNNSPGGTYYNVYDSNKVNTYVIGTLNTTTVLGSEYTTVMDETLTIFPTTGIPFSTIIPIATSSPSSVRPQLFKSMTTNIRGQVYSADPNQLSLDTYTNNSQIRLYGHPGSSPTKTFPVFALVRFGFSGSNPTIGTAKITCVYSP